MKDSFGTFTAGRDDAGRRLDRVIRKLLPELSLSRIYAALRKGDIRLSGRKADPASHVAERDLILIHRSLLGASVAGAAAPAPETYLRRKPGADPGTDITRLILNRTDDILALNKPRGMLVHDGDGSLEEAVRAALAPRLRESLSFTPGPLHRLDRNTSGLILFSSSLRGARTGSEYFREGKIEKYYLAVLDGSVRSTGVWEDRLLRDRERLVTEATTEPEGKPALTRCMPLETAGARTLCLLSIASGRTHQIRSQAALHGHPLSGDAKYGGKPLPGGYLLHSWGVRIPGADPVFGFESLYAPLFPDAEKKIELLFGKALHKKLSFYAILEANL